MHKIQEMGLHPYPFLNESQSINPLRHRLDLQKVHSQNQYKTTRKNMSIQMTLLGSPYHPSQSKSQLIYLLFHVFMTKYHRATSYSSQPLFVLPFLSSQSCSLDYGFHDSPTYFFPCSNPSCVIYMEQSKLLDHVSFLHHLVNLSYVMHLEATRLLSFHPHMHATSHSTFLVILSIGWSSTSQ